MRGGSKVVVEKHRHEGVFVAKGGKDDAIVTRNMDQGYSVYGEKRIAVEVRQRHRSPDTLRHPPLHHLSSAGQPCSLSPRTVLCCAVLSCCGG